jgi:hypothetical protein
MDSITNFMGERMGIVKNPIDKSTKKRTQFQYEKLGFTNKSKDRLHRTRTYFINIIHKSNSSRGRLFETFDFNNVTSTGYQRFA